jgi:hypothetical protein
VPPHPAALPLELAAGSLRGREESGGVAFSPLPTTWFAQARPFGPGGGARRRGLFYAAESGAAADPVEPWLDPAARRRMLECVAFGREL